MPPLKNGETPIKMKAAARAAHAEIKAESVRVASVERSCARLHCASHSAARGENALEGARNEFAESIRVASVERSCARLHCASHSAARGETAFEGAALRCGGMALRLAGTRRVYFARCIRR